MEIKPLFTHKLLRNSAPPPRETRVEKPWHRAAAYMFARGSTIKEVANALELTSVTVSNALKQPWFQQNVMELMAEKGAEDILELFRAEQFNSLITLVELRDSEDVSPTVKLNAAKDILDRALGKPTQRIEATLPQPTTNPADEERQLQIENERLMRSLSPVAARAVDSN
jgi:transposase-like protein